MAGARSVFSGDALCCGAKCREAKRASNRYLPLFSMKHSAWATRTTPVTSERVAMPFLFWDSSTWVAHTTGTWAASQIQRLEMRAIALGLEKAAAFQNNHADHEKRENDAPPIYFFHSDNPVYFYRCECRPIHATSRNFSRTRCFPTNSTRFETHTRSTVKLGTWARDPLHTDHSGARTGRSGSGVGIRWGGVAPVAG